MTSKCGCGWDAVSMKIKTKQDRYRYIFNCSMCLKKGAEAVTLEGARKNWVDIRGKITW